MKKCDLHTHSCFCDGKASPEEMVLSAIDKGLSKFGICVHSYVSFDEECCIHKDKYPDFLEEMDTLKSKYSDRIELLCGIEQDYYSEESTEGFDYIIGSVHYLKVEDSFVSVDNTPEELEHACSRYFNNDYYALCEEYFRLVSDVYNRTGCDIIGHFDLVSKFNEAHHYFDENGSRYILAAKKAVDSLILCRKPFEINFGAISRGYRTQPYPSADIIEYIKSVNGAFVYSSDAHSPENIAYMFNTFQL